MFIVPTMRGCPDAVSSAAVAGRAVTPDDVVVDHHAEVQHFAGFRHEPFQFAGTLVGCNISDVKRFSHVISCDESPGVVSPTRKKKTGVGEHRWVFIHAGTLVNGPPDDGLPVI
jgi:hypothetical protein